MRAAVAGCRKPAAGSRKRTRPGDPRTLAPGMLRGLGRRWRAVRARDPCDYLALMIRSPRPWVLALGAALALPLGSAAQPLPVDTSQTGWNAPRALDLIRQAQQRRTQSLQDTALLSYRADARAYVYFYLDRRDTGQRNLVKTDQVALEVLWRAPNLAKQRIVGWRNQKSMPTNIHYHIDHLAVVMENFGDEIRIGDGDEVSDVPHPAAPGAEVYYDYRLSDSLSLGLPGAGEPVRVYELQVRPKDFARPAFVGALFVDRREGALVRLDFTFTPASYRDRRLDYVNISLDNGLWKGRFWLPNEQRLEVRRQIPELDIPAGSVIRGSLRVSNYRFNEPLDPVEFAGRPVVLAPEPQRRAFPFEQGIHEELRAEGIGPAVELAEIRRQAMELARNRALSGLSQGLRLRLPAASDVLRYNRSEGAVLGLGVGRPLTPTLNARLHGGWAFGARHAHGKAELRWQRGPLRLGLSGYANQPRDVGVGPVASGAANTLAAFFAGRDYSDLYFAHGAALSARLALSPDWEAFGSLAYEDHDQAERLSGFSVFEGGDSFRGLQPIHDGFFTLGSLGVRRTPTLGLAGWWRGGLWVDGVLPDYSVELGMPGGGLPRPPSVEGRAARLQAELGWGRRWTAGATELELHARGGVTSDQVPLQQTFFLGGRGTVPGFSFREWAGNRYLFGGATLTTDLGSPWMRGRLHANAGAARLYGGNPLRDAPAFRLRGGDGASLGAGVGLVNDLLYLDVHRGLGAGGLWEIVVETSRGFWDFL